MELEIALDDKILLCGEGEWIDASYDHEFGRSKLMDFRLTDVKVYTWIRGLQINITPCIPDKLLIRWKELLVDEANLSS